MEHKEKITAKEGRVSHLPEKAPVDASGKEVLLSLKNVDITFGKGDNAVRAVKNASFDIYKGETFSLVGESGSGKTTIGRAVIRVNPCAAGEIYYKGVRISGKIPHSLDREVIRNIQMVFQDPYSSLDPRKTAGKLIEEPLIVHKLISDKNEREKRVLELMREVGLDIQHVHRFPHEFSGGQRQRINVARALAMNPKVIVCDEPVSALDVSIQAQVLNLFNRLQQQYNLTYIFISHDLGVIKHVSDRIAIMYLGRIVELCEADAIYENPLHPYTKALLSAIPPVSPFAKKERIVLKGDIPSPIGDQIGCPLAGRCPNCMDRCRKEIPKLKDAGDGHQVACFLYE